MSCADEKGVGRYSDDAREALFLSVQPDSSNRTRAIPAETVRTQLLTLGALENSSRIFQAAVVGNDRRWSVIMVTLERECSEQAVVLARDGHTGDWRHIMDFEYQNNCGRIYGYPRFSFPNVMAVEEDYLTMAFAGSIERFYLGGLRC